MKKITLILPLATVLGLSGCFKLQNDIDASESKVTQNQGGNSEEGSSGGLTNPPELPPGADPATIPPVGVGARDFSQVVMAMSRLTDVSHLNGNVQTEVAAVTGNLLTTSDLVSLSGPSIVATTKLASRFCDEVTAANDARRTAHFPGINFGGNPSAINNAARDTVLANLLVKFGLTTTAEAGDVLELTALYDDLKASLPNTAAGTRGLMVGVCTAALGSARVAVLY